MRELERLLARIRIAGGMQLYYDGWESHGKQFCDDKQIAEMERDLAKANADQDDAKRTLEACVMELRRHAPAELIAWVDAHIAYLEAFVASNEPDSTGVFVAKQEIEKWRDVRIGVLTYVDENVFYVTIDNARYRAFFGIDPQTLERVS